MKNNQAYKKQLKELQAKISESEEKNLQLLHQLDEQKQKEDEALEINQVLTKVHQMKEVIQSQKQQLNSSKATRTHSRTPCNRNK